MSSEQSSRPGLVNILTVVCTLVAAAAACGSCIVSCKANRLAKESQLSSEESSEQAEKSSERAIAAAEDANDIREREASISKRREEIAEQQKENIAKQTSLFDSQRHQFLIKSFQDSLNEAESRFHCCASCVQDITIGVPLEQAKRIETELRNDSQWKPSTVELLKLAALGCYVWDFRTVLDYCERTVEVAAKSHVPRERYLAHMIVGHAHFLFDTGTANGASFEDGRAAFRDALEALPEDNAREAERMARARFYAFWAHHEVYQHYQKNEPGSALSPDVSRIVEQARKMAENTQDCRTCGEGKDELEETLSAAQAGEAPGIPCDLGIFARTAKPRFEPIPDPYTSWPSFGKLVIYNATEQPHTLTVNGVLYSVLSGPHHVWIPFGEIRARIEPDGPAKMWWTDSWKWNGYNYEFSLWLSSDDGMEKQKVIMRTGTVPSSTLNGGPVHSAPVRTPTLAPPLPVE